jgi:hypothetical protein
MSERYPTIEELRNPDGTLDVLPYPGLNSNQPAETESTRTFVTLDEMLATGEPIVTLPYIVSQFMAHASPEVTLRYIADKQEQTQ